MPKKIIKIMLTIILLLIGLLIIIIGIQQSDFSKIKKYDQKSSGGFAGLAASRDSDKTRHDRSVRIQGDNMATLGDFNFNIAGDKTLIANITLKYKANEDRASWFESKKDIEAEILKKSILLRDAAINTMIGNDRASIDSKRLRRELKKNINKNLSCGEVEEVYFNKFLIQ